MRIITILSVFVGLVGSPVRVPAKENPSSWSFAVSGDSRNWGDIVMPAIAAGVQADHAQFYWHLGDFRAITDYDGDILGGDHAGRSAENCAGLFVFLAIGNHELVTPKTRDEYIAQFADWIDTPTIRAQRLKDDPKDHRLKTYYHWIQNGVDFILWTTAPPINFHELRWRG